MAGILTPRLSLVAVGLGGMLALGMTGVEWWWSPSQLSSDSLRERLLTLLAVNLLKVWLAIALCLSLMHVFVTRYLRRVANELRHVVEEGEPQIPEVRGAVSEMHGDLAELGGAIDSLRDRFAERQTRQRERTDQLERELVARHLVESRLQLMASAFENTQEAIMVTDAHNRIIAINQAFTRLTGYAADDVMGKNPKLLSAGMTHPDLYQQMWQNLTTKGSWQGELWDRRKDGGIYPKWLSITVVRDAVGVVVNYVAIFNDISERKDAEEQIFLLAHHDALTGLHNRMSLRIELTLAIGRAKMNNRMLAVMFIDLDRFKDINNVYGHDLGDQVLMQVAKRLRRCVRDSDIIGRPGGDEFVVILPSIHDTEVARKVAEQIRLALEQSYLLDGRQLLSSSSIGVAMFPTDGDTSDVLMKCADVAMYEAKARGRNNIQFYSASQESAMRERIRLAQDLRKPQTLEQFALHYQPKFDARSDRLVGLEALLRWQHPELGAVMPDHFISVAEEVGVIQQIGSWVLNEACRQMRAWRDQGLPDFGTVAVNLSAQQLASSDLLDDIARTLAQFDLPPTCLELEITESMLMQDIDANIHKLRALRQMGVKLSIDDFGTGYSSLSYLKLLPIDALKLDRSFIQEVDSDASNVAICISTITLAHNLGLKVVAEGVENEEQCDFLRRQRCDILQGYLLGPALPAVKVFEGLEQRDTE